MKIVSSLFQMEFPNNQEGQALACACRDHLKEKKGRLTGHSKNKIRIKFKGCVNIDDLQKMLENASWDRKKIVRVKVFYKIGKQAEE